MICCKTVLKAKRSLIFSALITALAGCGGGGSGSDGTAVDTLDGSVGDGPIIGASITLKDAGNNVIDSLVGSDDATYQFRLGARDEDYPLLVEAVGGTDLVTNLPPDMDLQSVSLHRFQKKANLNPFSTLIVKLAARMPGGVNDKNVEQAREIVIEELNFGLDTSLVADPIRTSINRTNVHGIVKASEALGEMVRRTRDIIASQEQDFDGNDVMESIVADMVDGYLDGQGAADVRPDVSAVVNIVSAQVLIEAMTNNLEVGGFSAGPLMDASIQQTTRYTSPPSTDEVLLTGQMVKQAIRAVAAAQEIAPSSALDNAASKLSRLEAGSTVSKVGEYFPDGSSNVLLTALNTIRNLNSADINAANAAAARMNGGVMPPVVQPPVVQPPVVQPPVVQPPVVQPPVVQPPVVQPPVQPPVVQPPSNTPPTISGGPRAIITEGSSYSFRPVANDADGDTLVFSIQNKPRWAGFNTRNGRLSGVPGARDAGSTFSGIAISVSDGTASVNLPVFSITVLAQVVSNNPPSISGNPGGSVVEGEVYSFIPDASDPDNDRLTFNISNKPSWASFDVNSGALTGTPGSNDSGAYDNINIVVSDGQAGATLPSFSINVQNASSNPPPAPLPPVVSGEPVLLYSDLERGPSGSLVTVWGQNIPAGAGLTCGDQACEILSSDFDPAHPAHGRQPSRQKIVVRFNSGSGITLDGYNTLPFQLTSGQIRFVSPSDGAITLNGASSGDVVYLRGGRYTQSLSCFGASAMICGDGNSGIAVVGYPGETAVLDCSQAAAFDVASGTLSDFTLANLEMDCGGVGRAIRASRQGDRRNLRVVGNYVHDARSSNSGAFGEFSTTVDLFVLGNLVERTGVAGENNAHAIYHGGRGISDNVHISYNHINTHLGGRAIQIFGHKEGERMTGLVIRGNHIVNSQGNAGILVSHSDAPAGLAPSDPARGWIKDALVEYNTVEGGNGSGINIKNIGVDATINNNVLIDGSRSVLIDFAKSVVASDNCMNQPISTGQSIAQSNNQTNYPVCLN